MKTISITDFNTSDPIYNFAVKNYEVYVAHYRARKLEPMPLKEFLKNYIS